MLLLHHPHCKLLVYTTLGRYLGKVVGVEINRAGDVLFYVVSTPWHLTNLWRRRLVINKNQVVAIEKTKIIVQDTIIQQPASTTIEIAGNV